jgi:hypothetical protein
MNTNVWIPKQMQDVLDNLFLSRSLLTVFIIGWLLFFTFKIYSSPSRTSSAIARRFPDFPDSNVKGPEKSPEKGNDPTDIERLYYIHRVWFGDESIVFALFNIWYYTLFLMIMGPLVRVVVNYMKSLQSV